MLAAHLKEHERALSTKTNLKTRNKWFRGKPNYAGQSVPQHYLSRFGHQQDAQSASKCTKCSVGGSCHTSPPTPTAHIPSTMTSVRGTTTQCSNKGTKDMYILNKIAQHVQASRTKLVLLQDLNQ